MGAYGVGWVAVEHRRHPVEHLKTFADIYAWFNRLYEAGRQPGPIIGGACWSHSRRKFYELADIEASKRRGKNAPLALRRKQITMPTAKTSICCKTQIILPPGKPGRFISLC